MIPVFIALPSFVNLLKEPSTRKKLMMEVFTELLIDCPSLALFENDRFLFIFDGLDELGFQFNLFDDCNLQPWASHSKFVVTSRLGFLSEVSGLDVNSRHCLLQADVSKYIAPHVSNSREADLDRVVQVFVAPFNKEQIHVYVEKFALSKELNMDQWSAAQFQAALHASPDVAGLVSSPLMLFMVLTILPTISADGDKVTVLNWCCNQFTGERNDL